MIRWSPALAIGHGEIDAQHQELFEALGRLVAALGRGDPAEIGPLFDFLGDYAVRHFADEEAVMREADFPGYAVHKAAHDRFVREYTSLRQLYDENGPTPGISLRTGTWIADWLLNHIGVTDQAMGRHLLRRSA